MKEFNINSVRRQFIAAHKDIEISIEGWLSLSISDTYLMHHCPDLPVAKCRTTDNKTVLFIGDSQYSLTELTSKIETLDSDAFLLFLNDIAGRWLSIIDDKVYTDVSGMFGFYYTENNVFSSSLYLLSAMGIAPQVMDLSNIVSSKTRSLIPPLIKGVEKKLSFEAFDISNWTAVNIPTIVSELYELSFEDAMHSLNNYIVNAVKKVVETEGNIWIALSAGYDCRVLLSILLKEQAGFESYTFYKENKFQDIFSGLPTTTLVSYSDMNGPAEIASKFGFNHRYIRRSEFSSTRLIDFDYAVSYAVKENDRAYISFGQWEEIPNNSCVLLGQVAEIGAKFYYKNLNKPNNRFFDIDSLNKLFNPLANIEISKSLMEYARRCEQQELMFNENIPCADRAYLDLRLGGWCSLMQKGIDITGIKRLHLFNSRNIVTLLLRLSHLGLSKEEISIEIIKMNEPSLLNYPFNARDPLLFKLKKFILLLLSKGPAYFNILLRRLKIFNC